MRNLRLTSPLAHGTDVRDLQRAINARAKEHPVLLDQIGVDGDYGPATDAAARKVAWLLGFGPSHIQGPIKPGVQRLIAHPDTRNPTQRKRAQERQKVGREHSHSLSATLDWCRAQVGTTESPANSNRGPKVSKWELDHHMDGQPWCGAFVSFALRHIAGIATPDGMVYTPNIINYGRTGTGGMVSFHSWADRKPGDLALFKWPGVSSAACDHVGIVDEDNRHTIEGNTSAGNSGSQNNGGGVYRRDRGGQNCVGVTRPRWN